MSIIVGYIVKKVTLCIIKVVVSDSHNNVHKYKTKGGKSYHAYKIKERANLYKVWKDI